MDFICGKCKQILNKSPELLIRGCPSCGSKVFTTKTEVLKETTPTIPVVKSENIEQYLVREYRIVPRLLEETSDEEKRQSELAEDNIPAIKLRKKGIYDVNLDSLFRDKKSDPIILSGKQGIYRIEIFPSEER